MNWDRLTLVTGPASNPVTVAEIKEEVHIDESHEDSYIDGLVSAAASAIDGPRGAGTCMVSQQWKLTLDEFPVRIRIPMVPLISVDSITYTDTDGVSQTLSSAVYQVTNYGDLAIVTEAFGQSWPSTRDIPGAVVVTFTCGHATVPAILKRAVIMMVRDWHERPESKGTMPAHAERILNQYRAGTIAA